MDPADRTNRTWLCCVVFTDIVGYSMQSTRSQLAIKEIFNHYLSDALKEASPNDLVILDTGDGAAICVSDPEEALFACLAMQSSFARDESIPNFKLGVRIGINLGSVKLIRDLNGNLNAVGDGINVAQRVMSFAGPNQILASRSFYEVASSLSEEYQKLFSYKGIRTDKHVKEHSVYALTTPEQSARATVPAPAPPAPAQASWPAELLHKIEAKLALANRPHRQGARPERRAHPKPMGNFRRDPRRTNSDRKRKGRVSRLLPKPEAVGSVNPRLFPAGGAGSAFTGNAFDRCGGEKIHGRGAGLARGPGIAGNLRHHDRAFHEKADAVGHRGGGP